MTRKVRQILAAVSLSLFLIAGASAQIKINQTDGFGKDQLLTFTDLKSMHRTSSLPKSFFRFRA